MSARTDEAPPMPPTASNNKARWLVPVLLVALTSHAYVYFFFHYEPSNDAREYLDLGLSLSKHGELRLPTGEYAKRMPLYPALIALTDRWQGDRVLLHAVVEVQTILSLASTLLIALIARRLSDARGAVVAGLVAALYSPYRYLQSVYLSETLVITLLAGSLYFYVVSLQSRSAAARWTSLAAVSALLGLALLTRADTAVFVVPFAIHAAYQAGPAGIRIVRAVVLLIGITLAALGWGGRNQQVLGTWTLSTMGGLNFYLGHNAGFAAHPGMDQADYGAFDRLRREEGLSEIEANQRLFKMGRTFIVEHPGEAAVNLLRKIRVWLGSSVTWSAPGTPLIILWMMAVAGYGSRHRRTILVLAVLMSFVWLVVITRVDRPWTNPTLVVPLGLIGLFAFEDRLKVRWLLVGLVASQLAVAIVFIPLERLRWIIDAIFIITLAAAAARIFNSLSARPVLTEPPP